MTQDFEIAIIGGGMTGLSCALGLAQKGFKIAVIDTKPLSDKFNQENDPDRVSAVNLASEKLLQSLKVWPKIISTRSGIYTSMHVCDANTSAVLEFHAEEVSESNLGHIVENDLITSTLLKKIGQNDVEILAPKAIREIEYQDQGAHWQLTLSDGQLITAPLIIGADGANSFIREHFDFDCRKTPYHHDAIIATIQLEKAHQNGAYQQFLNQGILALLPLHKPHLASFVYSLDPSSAKRLITLDQAYFEAMLQARFNQRFGQIELVTKAKSFPLIERHVNRYYRKGIVLIGDAAHSVHPLAGQGANLGFADVTALIQTLDKAKQSGRNFAAEDTLDAYERQRKLANTLMLKGVKGIKTLFEKQNFALKFARKAGISAVNNNTLLKRFFIRQAMGT